MAQTPYASPLFDIDDPIYDFKYDTVVDSSDPGFDTEYDTDSDDSISSINLDDPTAIASYTDTKLRALTNDLQTEFLKQPKSTQLVLTHEVAQVFESYRRHGSAARLSMEVMKFLDAGDIALREAKRDIVEEEVDAANKATGGVRVVKRDVVERARLRFVPLPVGKRKAEKLSSDDDDGARRGEKRFGVWDGMAVAPGLRDRGSPVEARKVVCEDVNVDVNVMDVDKPVKSVGCGPARSESSFTGIVDRTGSQEPVQHPLASRYQHERKPRPLDPQPTAPPPAAPRTPPHQTISSNSVTTTSITPPIPPHLYSLTTDLETQSLLLTQPFQPSLTPLYLPPHPITKSHTSTIISLHIHAASHLHNHLLDKYTLPSSTVQPPAALIRLAILSKLQDQINSMYTETMDDEHAIEPTTRALMRQLYEVKPGKLNGLETQVVGRVTGVDRESISAVWEERGQGLLAWNALRCWVQAVEGESIERAKREGRY